MDDKTRVHVSREDMLRFAQRMEPDGIDLIDRISEQMADIGEKVPLLLHQEGGMHALVHAVEGLFLGLATMLSAQAAMLEVLNDLRGADRSGGESDRSEAEADDALRPEGERSIPDVSGRAKESRSGPEGSQEGA